MSDHLRLKLYTVDAFSSKPFYGNPAAVCPVSFDMIIDDHMLQNIAEEMNLSETAYIRPLTAEDDIKKDSRFGLRWFTTNMEVKLCGHATLAAAAVLFYKLGNPSEKITFETLSGDLVVSRDGDYIAMDFPVGTLEPRTAAEYEHVIKYLGKVPGIHDVLWCSSLDYLLIRLQDGFSRSEFEQWHCDMSGLEHSVSGLVLLVITTTGSPEQGYKDDEGVPYDFVSRAFGPWCGTAEDPVTGSAQTILARYWNKELGKTEFYTRQCSKRGGEIRIKLAGERVHLLGKATIVMEGVLDI